MLNKEERKYLWSKIEYKKKKTAIEQENKLFNLLNSDEKINEDDFIFILNSLEYSFKKRLKEGPDFKSDIFLSIKDKLPKSWLGVKYSSLAAKKKKDERKPTKTSTKSDIINYLKNKNIDHDPKKPKKDLLNLLEKRIMNWQQFNKHE